MILHDNVAAMAYLIGGDNTVKGGYGYASYYLLFTSNNVTIPLVRGADTSVIGNPQVQTKSFFDITFSNFTNNESYGGLAGFWPDHRKGGLGTGGHHIINFKGWNFFDAAIVDYDSSGLTIDGLVARNSSSGLRQLGSPFVHMINSDIQTCQFGILDQQGRVPRAPIPRISRIPIYRMSTIFCL